jgi:hypothetical protein
MDFFKKLIGRGEGRESAKEGKEPTQLRLSELEDKLDGRLRESEIEALKKSGPSVKLILEEKIVARGIVEEIRDIEFDEDIKDRTYKPILTSKPVYIRGMLEGLKGIKEAKPENFEELATFSERVMKSLKKIQNVQHKKGRYMSFAFQKEMLSLGTHLNNMINATTRLEEEISSVEGLSSEVGRTKKKMGVLEDEIRRMEEGSAQEKRQSRRAQELAKKIGSLELELAELEGAEENAKILEMEDKLERTQSALRELKGTIHSLLSPLKRPFRKYEKLLEGRNVKTEKEILKKLREYQDAPNQAFSGEAQSNIILPVILSGLKDSITKGDLKLSEREQKKTIHRIGRLEGGMIQDSLKEMEALKEEAEKIQDRLSQSEIKERIRDLTSRLEALRIEQTESLEESPRESTPDIQLDEIMKGIEESASQLLGQNVKLIIPELGNADIREDL